MKKRNPSILFNVICIAFFIAAALPNAAASATIRVPDDQPTIQAAIDVAANGDIILVDDGIYSLPSQPNDKYYLDFNGKAITIRSVNGPGSTTILGGSKSRGVLFHSGEGSDSVLDGFTIRDCSGLGNGGGIYCRDSSSPTIKNNIIINNSATSLGGGICCVGSSPIIENNIISYNSATNKGGGVYCDGTSSPTISGNTIGRISEPNFAYSGGGIFCDAGSSPDISDNAISNNIATYRGGGIHCEANSLPTVFDNVISNNIVTGKTNNNYGGGGISIYNCSPSIMNNTISDNTGHKGGGIACWGSDISLCKPDISYNSILNNGWTISDYGPTTNGGGIYCNSSAPRIFNNNIENNFASNKGGGITASVSSKPVISNNIVSANESTNDGGGIQIANSSGTITNNNILNNIAGSGIGGGVYCDGASPGIINCIIYGNGDDLYGYSASSSFTTLMGNPLFVDPSNGDYHLQSNSPCIDVGDNDAPDLPDTDYEGNPRILDGDNDGLEVVDIGAYEYIPQAGIVLKLIDSSGKGISGGTAKYYKGGWQDIPGSTDSNGKLVLDEPGLEGNIKFRMYHAGASRDKNQNISSDPIVTFQTVNVTVGLQDSDGDTLPPEDVKYYASGWKTFGSEGNLSMELLPKSYKFRMYYGGASQDKNQNVDDDPAVVFQTKSVSVVLKDSGGSDTLPPEDVKYYASGWKAFGSEGNLSMELLPKSYKFRMYYGGASQDATQDVEADPTVEFHTANVQVTLLSSGDVELTPEEVKYYASGWKAFGSEGNLSMELLPKSYKFRVYYGGASLDDTLEIASGGDPTVVTFNTVNVTVELRNSAGNLIDSTESGTVKYYASGWQDFGAATGGQVSKELLAKTYKFRMSYEGASQDKTQDVASDATVIFNTVSVAVKLLDNDDKGIDGGVVKYYASGWQDFGTTGDSGVSGETAKELLAKTYKFRMTYEGASNDISQDVAVDTVVVFKNASPAVTVILEDSLGNGIPGGEVKYYASGWKEFGVTGSDGKANKELLPNTYKFRMYYEGASMDKTQDVGSNPTVTFQTAGVTVELQNSSGSPLDTGAVKYYASGWKDFGTTAGGTVSKELLPKSYKFRMSYEGASQDKTQDVAGDATVIFNTVNVTVELRDSKNDLIDTGTVKYYASGWKAFGTTSGGQVNKELLPKSYKFRMSYGGASVDKTQNVGSTATVIFQTTGVIVQLQDSGGSPLDTGTVKYYASGWKAFGTTSGGQVSKELLPKSYKFRMSYGGASIDKTQNVASTAIVSFQTGKVVSDSGNCTKYYASGWKTFSSGLELLPKTYKFRFNDGFADTNYAIFVATTNNIH